LFDDPVENDLIDELPSDAVGVTLTLVANGPAERLDKWLAGQLPDRSRAEIQRWIESGLVTSRGGGLKASHKVALGDEIAVVIPAAETYATALRLQDEKNWYLGTNIPGKPRAVLVYQGGLGFYKERCDEIAADGYRGFVFTPAREMEEMA
jgi:ribosomal 50S subunit-recycling heat shock protein